MKFVRQPADTNQCGQACVAMLCDLTLAQAIELIGTKGKTKTKQLVTALRAKGVECGDRLVRGLPEGPAILKFVQDGKAHWVVWFKNKYYDPLAGVFREVPIYLIGARVTSHLPVWRNWQTGLI